MVQIETIASQGAPVRPPRSDALRGDVAGFHRLIDQSGDQRTWHDAEHRGSGAKTGRGAPAGDARGPADTASAPARDAASPDLPAADPADGDAPSETVARVPAPLESDVEAAVRALIGGPRPDEGSPVDIGEESTSARQPHPDGPRDPGQNHVSEQGADQGGPADLQIPDGLPETATPLAPAQTQAMALPRSQQAEVSTVRWDVATPQLQAPKAAGASVQVSVSTSPTLLGNPDDTKSAKTRKLVSDPAEFARKVPALNRIQRAGGDAAAAARVVDDGRLMIRPTSAATIDDVMAKADGLIPKTAESAATKAGTIRPEVTTSGLSASPTPPARAVESGKIPSPSGQGGFAAQRGDAVPLGATARADVPMTAGRETRTVSVRPEASTMTVGPSVSTKAPAVGSPGPDQDIARAGGAVHQGGPLGFARDAARQEEPSGAMSSRASAFAADPDGRAAALPSGRGAAKLTFQSAPPTGSETRDLGPSVKAVSEPGDTRLQGGIPPAAPGHGRIEASPAVMQAMDPSNTAAPGDHGNTVPSRGMIAQDDRVLASDVTVGAERPARSEPAPAATPSATPNATAPRPVPAQIAVAVASASPGTSSIELSLAPEELGRVTITLNRGEAGLSVVLLAERDDTMAMLRRHGEQLREAFTALDQGSVDISFAGGGAGPERRRDETGPRSEAGPSDLPGHAVAAQPKSRLGAPDGRLDLRM
ncbi:hook-length control protein FliK [Palleronia salina]|uniref:Hook-length control protein FliK n=1 Tax=Palleronia salina TaxID=313368 RepID=A0A1M6ED50_9RHOB|nr:flagellar hook-length control protein FliK [Palleronia salina]SHI83361.1 hook-length control protein FliK [Palleronia salina]